MVRIASGMSHGALAIMLAVLVLLLHLLQVDRLSGSIEEYWRRRDSHARASKILFAVSLCSCGLMLITPVFGGFLAIALMAGSIGLSMKEWIK